MTDVYTVVGPPGTGKTTYVARQCRKAVEVHGSQGVVVCSLTRAAASEAAGRDTGVDSANVGTLHALCYRALGRPRLLVGAQLRQWNETNPRLALTVKAGGSLDEPAAGEALPAAAGGAQQHGAAATVRPPDDVFADMEVLRARRVRREDWPPDVLHFAHEWDAFKVDAGLFDFTDLIERALEDLPHAPGMPDALFVDEAQDLSRLELDLVHKWAARARKVVIVGDPWQAIYSWRGSSPDVFAGRPHAVLADSFRVPRAVHDVALGVIRRSLTDWREDIAYNPRDAEGSVQRWIRPGALRADHAGVTWTKPRAVARLAEDALVAGRAASADGDGAAARRVPALMILASCDYMLGPLKRMLREAAIPYGNPYTPRWNPISREARARAAAVLNPARDFLGGAVVPSPYAWTPEQVRRWAPCFRVDRGDGDGVLRRGWKSRLETLPDGLSPQEVTDAVAAGCVPRAIEALSAGDCDWLAERVGSGGESLAYALRSVARWGWSVLESEMPTVVLSTIHGAKGGEAERVVLFPDLSPAAARQMARPGWEDRDAVFRQFYVAVTRAREELVIAAAENGDVAV